jgi:hypothetical protein
MPKTVPVLARVREAGIVDMVADHPMVAARVVVMAAMGVMEADMEETAAAEMTVAEMTVEMMAEMMAGVTVPEVPETQVRPVL